MRNIKLVVQYDGSRFHGFAKQSGDLPTVQAEIERAIFVLTKQNPEIFYSGRTDAGVHALGQVINFRLEGQIPLLKLMTKLNSVLSGYIRVVDIAEVDDGFDARFSAMSKTYRYVLQTTMPTAFESAYVGFESAKIDFELFKKALSQYKGKHNFKAFCSSGASAKTFNREIFSVSAKCKAGRIVVDISGSGFLYNMVRIMIGTAVDIATGKKSISCIQSAYQTQDRGFLGRTFSPNGLYLLEVKYE